VIRIFPVPNLMLLPSSAALRRFAAVCALSLIVLLSGGRLLRAQSQPNFKPLERGDLTEEEQKLLVIRGIEVSGDYAMRLSESLDKNMPNLDNQTLMNQDFRLHLDTVFNQDVSMRLTVQTATTNLDPTNLRATQTDNRGTEANGLSLQLVAREAYLQYRFNPNSAINIGQFDLTLGDHNGKVFQGIASGIDFNCRVGTWCMPFGATKVGQGASDWIYHWALRYNAYDDQTDKGRRAFSAEIFRILYTESNIPLGGNLGPSTYDPINPTVATRVQLTDDCTSGGCGTTSGNPIYFDANGYNYFGLNLDWQTPSFYATFDLTNAQGSRAYHLFRSAATGIASGPTTSNGAEPILTNESIDGYATEVNMGYRWAAANKGQLGFRYMTASGDENSLSVNSSGQYVSPSGSSWQHGLTGYYEITPGTYRGTRLYFNGVDTQVDLGGGLGHSVNNKEVYGVYIDYTDQEGSHLGYSAGLYQINLHNSILNAAGFPVKNVGLELDNMLTWYFHPRMRLQFEANLLESGGAMSVDDFTPPPVTPELFVQVLARLVYQF
jgi:hypothetical protein